MNIFDILTNFGIMETTIAMIIGLTFRDMLYNLADEFLVPLLLIFFGIKKTINDIKFTYHGTVMHTGIILLGLVRTILITFLVLGLLKYIIYPVTEEVIYRRNESNKKIICELEKLNKGTSNLGTQLLEIKTEVKEQVNPNVLLGKQLKPHFN
jgi:large-conductance mechanosensitive channel